MTHYYQPKYDKYGRMFTFINGFGNRNFKM